MTWRTSGWPGFGPNNFRGSVNVADGNVNVAGDLNLTDSAAFTTTLQCITPTANRTVSIPDATGTLGLIGGSSGNLVWNNAGAYAGALNSTVDSSGNITLGARFTNSVAAALSAPPVSVTGAWVTTGGTATTTKPTVVIEPTGTTSTGWSTAGTGLGVNAPSGFTGRLLDLQVNGSSAFNVGAAGTVSGAWFSVSSSNVPSNGIYLPGSNALGFATNNAFRGLIDSSGRLFLGTPSARSNLLGGASTSLYIESTTSTGFGAATQIRNSADNGAAYTLYGKTRGTTIGSSTIVQNNDDVGATIFYGADGSNFIEGGGIIARVDGAPGTNNMPMRLVFTTTVSGASAATERLRITNEGVLGYNQPAPAAVDATATLTVANLKAGIITSTTAAAVTMTLPTGTLTEGGFNGLYTNFTFEWSVINTGGTNAVTIAAGTDHTLVGSGTVNANDSGRFASRRTAANTFVTYRLS